MWNAPFATQFAHLVVKDPGKSSCSQTGISPPWSHAGWSSIGLKACILRIFAKIDTMGLRECQKIAKAVPHGATEFQVRRALPTPLRVPAPVPQRANRNPKENGSLFFV